MRLGQLARHLDTTIPDIKQFLQDKGVEFNPHPNSKLDEQVENLVVDHFMDAQSSQEKAPAPLINKLKTETDVNPEPPISPTETKQPEPIQETETINDPTLELESDVPSAETDEVPAHDTETPTPSDIEVIRAPKVSLPGLKVIGKIDLPEPKKKEDKEDKAELRKKEESVTQQDGMQVIRHNKRNARKQLTEEEKEAKRQRNKKMKERRLAQAAEKRKKEAERKEKAKREAHYQQKIQRAKTSKASNTKNRPASSKKAHSPKKKTPTTLLGKFWKWLNT